MRDTDWHISMTTKKNLKKDQLGTNQTAFYSLSIVPKAALSFSNISSHPGCTAQDIGPPPKVPLCTEEEAFSKTPVQGGLL